MHPHLTLINVPEFDWPLEHVDGGNLDGKDTITLTQQFDWDVGEIEDQYRKAGILDKTLFVITADLGVSPRAMEGRVLADALEHPRGTDQRARDTEIKQLQPVVQALVWQDAYQRSHVPYQHR